MELEMAVMVKGTAPKTWLGTAKVMVGAVPVMVKLRADDVLPPGVGDGDLRGSCEGEIGRGDQRGELGGAVEALRDDGFTGLFVGTWTKPRMVSPEVPAMLEASRM